MVVSRTPGEMRPMQRSLSRPSEYLEWRFRRQPFGVFRRLRLRFDSCHGTLARRLVGISCGSWTQWVVMEARRNVSDTKGECASRSGCRVVLDGSLCPVCIHWLTTICPNSLSY